MTAFAFPNTVTLTLSASSKTGTVAVTRDGNGRIRFNDGVKDVDFHGNEGLNRLFETINALEDQA